jgi:hypothetical protein
MKINIHGGLVWGAVTPIFKDAMPYGFRVRIIQDGSEIGRNLFTAPAALPPRTPEEYRVWLESDSRANLDKIEARAVAWMNEQTKKAKEQLV